MQANLIGKAGFFGLSLMILSSCDGGALSGQKSFRNQYTVARNALEAGDYDLATRSYASLISQAGPLEPRIRLEYAHTLLRSGEYDKAAEQARWLTGALAGSDRAAALSVQATAEHELGLIAIGNGDAPTGKVLLQSADAGMAEVLRSHPEMDPLGALAGRRASIKVRLAAI